jgi:hypothetical protein
MTHPKHGLAESQGAKPERSDVLRRGGPLHISRTAEGQAEGFFAPFVASFPDRLRHIAFASLPFLY